MKQPRPHLSREQMIAAARNNSFIDESFQQYIESVYPEMPVPDQMKQLRCAWFGSAVLMLSALTKVTDENTDEETEDEKAFFDGIEAEMFEYQTSIAGDEDVVQGR